MPQTSVEAPSVPRQGLWRGPFASSGFRWFFLGITFLSLGVWTGDPAVRWFVQDLTGEPFWVGFIGFCASFPMLVFSLPGGVLADRVDRVLLFTVGRGTGALLTLSMAAGILLSAVGVAHVAVYTLIVGALVAIEIPARQALIPRLVTRERLMGAVAISSGVWSTSLMLGPAISGWIISSFGTAWCLALAGAMHVVAVLVFLQLREQAQRAEPPVQRESPWRSLVAGLAYIRHHEVILGLIIVTIVCTVLGQPATMALLPSFSAGVLHAGPEVYGLLLTGMGLGSVLANAGLASRPRWPRRGRMVVLVALVLALTSLGMAAARTAEAAFMMITAQGMMQAALLTLTSTLVQATVDEEMRGRVLSAYMLTWGMTSAGSLFFGAVGSLLGVPAALAVAGALLLVAVAVIRARLPVIWALE